MSKLTHNSKFVPSAISLTAQKMRKDNLKLLGVVQDGIEKILVDNDFFDGLPFVWIGVSILYGLKNDLVPEHEGIDKDYECLDLRIEINCEGVLKMTPEEFTQKIEWVTYYVLIDVCKKYNKDDTFIKKHFAHLLACH